MSFCQCGTEASSVEFGNHGRGDFALLIVFFAALEVEILPAQVLLMDGFA